MNKYRVPVKLIFTGTVDVIAEDDGEAEDIALANFGGILDHAELIDNYKVCSDE